MKKNEVTLYRLPWGMTCDYKNRENWYQHRTSGMIYYTDLEGEKAAEEAFHLTNAPEECLSDEHKKLLLEQNFKGSSLSVGDVVRVESVLRGYCLADYYLCKSFGWEKFEGDRLKFLGYLS
jgi:hypothetical protein